MVTKQNDDRPPQRSVTWRWRRVLALVVVATACQGASPPPVADVPDAADTKMDAPVDRSTPDAPTIDVPSGEPRDEEAATRDVTTPDATALDATALDAVADDADAPLDREAGCDARCGAACVDLTTDPPELRHMRDALRGRRLRRGAVPLRGRLRRLQR